MTIRSLFEFLQTSLISDSCSGERPVCNTGEPFVAVVWDVLILLGRSGNRRVATGRGQAEKDLPVSPGEPTLKVLGKLTDYPGIALLVAPVGP